MTYEGARRVRHGKWSRRSFIQATGAGIAAGAAGSVFPHQVRAAEGLRSIGLGVSEINEIQNKATKDLGFAVAGQAMGYGECLTKLLNQNDQYEIGGGTITISLCWSPQRRFSQSTLNGSRIGIRSPISPRLES